MSNTVTTKQKWNSLNKRGQEEAARRAKYELKKAGLDRSAIGATHALILLTCATNEVYNIPQYRK